MGSGPYGPFAVSPMYRIASCGSWSSTARATVRPPTPESKIPMGASAPRMSLLAMSPCTLAAGSDVVPVSTRGVARGHDRADGRIGCAHSYQYGGDPAD